WPSGRRRASSGRAWSRGAMRRRRSLLQPVALEREPEAERHDRTEARERGLGEVAVHDAVAEEEPGDVVGDDAGHLRDRAAVEVGERVLDLREHQLTLLIFRASHFTPAQMPSSPAPTSSTTSTG